MLIRLIIAMMVLALVQAPLSAAAETPGPVTESQTGETGSDAAVISPEQVQQALAQGEPGQEKTVRLAVQAETDADRVTVRMNAALIVEITSDHERNLIVWETPIGEFAIITNGMYLEWIAGEAGIAIEEIELEITFKKADAEQSAHIRRAAEAAGMTLHSEPISLRLDYLANGQPMAAGAVIGYFSQWLPPEPAINWDHASGIRFDPERGFLQFVPAAALHQDGRQLVTIMSEGSGMYFIANREKSFTDIADEDFARQAIQRLAARGVIAGPGDGTFRPDAPLTKAELATMFAQFFSLADEEDAQVAAEIFADVNAEDWYARFAGALYLNGFLEEGPFNPEDEVTADDIYALIFVDENLKFLIDMLAAERIEAGGPSVTRAEAALIFNQLLEAFEASIERSQRRSLQD